MYLRRKQNLTSTHAMRGLVSQSGGDGAGNDRKAFWQAEVTKMIKVYGAPIAEGDVAGIVEYLATTY
jgi:hypothetical protein